jgi:4-diphosphocytidyl-2-C-methyl-D-erythritol kinase
MILFPNAKINIGLRVTDRRSDGFHAIESLFYPLPMCDVLEFLPAQTFRLQLFGKAVPGAPSDNLVSKTWHLMHHGFSIPAVEAVLLKNIPPGSGLGGGSSDAAFFLMGLNDFFHLQLSQENLMEIALQLGSDVPFFLRNRPAFVSGRGEKFSVADRDLSGYWLVVVWPGMSFSTSDMFAGVKYRKPQLPLEKLLRQPVEKWKEKVVNDFEALAFAEKPVLAEIKQEFYRSGALYASLTGTGSALYGIFREKPQIRNFMAYGEVFRYVL